MSKVLPDRQATGPAGRGRRLRGPRAAAVVAAAAGREPAGRDDHVQYRAPAGVYQQYGELLRNALAKDMPDLEVRLLASDGSQENVERVATGDADFTIAAADAVETYNAGGSRAPTGCAASRACTTTTCSWSCRRTPTIRTVEDLRGKRVAIGLPNSGVRLIADRRAEGRRDRPGEGHQALSPTASTPGPGGWSTAARRVLLVGRAAHGRRWRSSPKTFAFRFVPLDADLVAKLHEQGGATRYYRADQHAGVGLPDHPARPTVPTIAVSNLLITTRGRGPAAHRVADPVGDQQPGPASAPTSTRPSSWTCAPPSTPTR